MVSTAKSYKPAHGGYPAAKRTRRRLTAGLLGQTPAQAAAGGMVVNVNAPPPPHGFGPGHLHEAYELGRRSR